MELIVLKFGGSSVANVEKIRNVCNIIKNAYDKGNKVVVVLSAQGDTTDDLISKANEISSFPSKREMDSLLSVGEQISISLTAMCLEGMGYEAISLNGQQAAIKTDSSFGSAYIECIETKRIVEELELGKIVIVAGFQGVDNKGNITTLGRGGSDTTAVALAAALSADKCQIYTDVDGVYSCDPRKNSNATKYDKISYDDMLSLINSGAQVLHDRCVLLAKKHNMTIEVLSSFSGNPGTLVC